MVKYKLVEIKKPEPAFLEKMMAGLRSDDRKELLATGSTIQKELEESILYAAECYAAVTDEGDPIVLFGRTMIPERDGAMIWCVATDVLKDYWLPFLKVSREILRKWAHDYGELYNAVAAFNTIHLRWLGWLGAKFGEEITINGEQFIRFSIAEEDM